MPAIRSIFLSAALGVAAFGALPAPATAQGLFAPIVTVGDRVVTNYELQQRILLLELFRSPGDINQMALTQLVDERVKQAALERAGLALTDDGLRDAMSDIAANANLELDAFLARLAQNGVEEQTFRDYVSVNIAWRDYIRLRYGDAVTITEADVDRALQATEPNSAGVELLLGEIILPAPPDRAAEAQRVAEQIAGITSFAAFEAAAREVSASRSREQSGRLPWAPLSNYPPALHPVFLGLEPGEVTAPIPITNGIVLFQLRDVREVAAAPAAPAQLDYMIFLVPNGEGSLAEAAGIAARLDSCQDLYGVAAGLPEERLIVESRAPGEVPQDIALELAKLDADETSVSLTSGDGQWRYLLMLCDRFREGGAEADREVVRGNLRSQQLAGYADALLADLTAGTPITYE
ncbi:peptidyl-prolyl cis-trans isomerase [Pseudoroseicyclus tamaricis]|uniref:Parvulin-like PPIase n=1 Tax=Pseudoroseicyclus tamaricis TaxID=2705421 RepID=A0A6B2K4K3_9RHOB|nr:peptidylprolyl isomerase [Pseudoroseicyclus tamaricis]NDV01626.1 peptidylprolyl isomerase [Pseudoroseicyclus tamaricis]